MLCKFFGCACLLAVSLPALPTGREIIQGQASLSSSTDFLQINANGKAILHWEDFSIASHEAVHFFQAEGNQAILNRVTSSSVSEILGLLQANCPIYLVNPNGIFIGSNASIDTAGFIASTADLSNDAFLRGKEFLFQEFGSGRIVNLGKVFTSDGDILLIARGIENRGQIEAPSGRAVLATCEILLNPDTKEHVFIRADESSCREEGIQNSGTLQALQVELRTQSPYERAINHTGAIEAVKAAEKNGRIYLVAEKGEAFVDGTLKAGGGEIRVLGQKVHVEKETFIDVSGPSGGVVLIGGDYQGTNPDILNAKETFVAEKAQIHADADVNGDGGKVIIWSDRITYCAGSISACGGSQSGDGGLVEVSGKRLQFNGKVSTAAPFGKIGTLLLDPTNVTISNVDSGGSFSGCVGGTNTFSPDAAATDTIAAATLAGLLNGPCNVTISTVGSTGGGTGAITVSNAVSWSAPTTLTLTAESFITISASITNTSATTGFTAVSLTANGLGATTNPGIHLTAGTITTAGGDVTLNGTSAAIASASHGVYFDGGSIATGSGNISVTGLVPVGAASGVNGIYLRVGAVVTSTSGNITFSGTSFDSKPANGFVNTSSFNFLTTGTVTFSNCKATSLGSGVAINGSLTFVGDLVFSNCQGGAAGLFLNTTISSAGNITANQIIATGAGGIGYFCNGGTISLSGAGKAIVMNASTTGTSGTCRGIFLSGSISAVGAGSSITLNGTGGASNAASFGINFAAGTITTGTGNISLTGTGGTVSGSANQGIIMTGGSITSTNGIISLTGNGGIGSNGIQISLGTVSTSGTGNITALGTGGAGTGGYGMFLTGASSLIQTTGSGSISLTGNGAGTGANAGGIGVFSSARILATNAGAVTLTGTASSVGGSTCRGIVVNGASSTVSSNSGTITLSGTGGGTSINSSGLEVSAGGKISSTSGLITGTCRGGAGTSGCTGIFVTGSPSLITTATGGINLTGIGNGTTTSNQGISLAAGGAITTTGNAPITLMGTGSSSGTGSDEGIFMTGVLTKVSTATGAIHMTGVAGGGSTNGITVDTSASVVSTAAGLVTLTSANNNVAVQNNSSVRTQGVGGPGINDISIASKGLSVTGGAAGSAVVSTVNGNITVASTGPVSVTGSTAGSSFGQITVGNSANTVGIQMAGLTLTAGSGSGAFAEISTVGGLLTIDGAGAISLTGGSNTNTEAQIITKTNAIVGDAIRIGQMTMPTTLTLLGGSGGTLSRAVIASDVGGNILCSTSGNYTITGGTGNTDSRAGFYTGLTSGSGNITLSGAGYLLTGGPSGTGYNSAEILTLAGGGNILLTYTTSNSSLQGGGGSTSNARIMTLGTGTIAITGSGNFSAMGGSGASSVADVNAQGALTFNIGTGSYTLTGGSGTSSLARFTATGAASLTGHDYTLTAGNSAAINGSDAVIQSTGTNITLNLAANNGGAVALNGGAAADQHSYIQTTGGGTNPISMTCGSLSLNGSGAANGSAEIKTVQGNIGIAASGNISLAGAAMGSNALIHSTTQGAMTLSAANLFIQGGVGAGTSGIETQAGDISITCVQNAQCTAPNAGAVAIETFGSDLTLTVGGSITLSGSVTLSTPAPTGNILLIAGKDISIGTSVQVSAHGTVNSSLTLVVDNAFPASPSVGPGAFALDTGGVVSAGAGTPVKIYTARSLQNTINAPINGTPFVPGPIGVDTPTEQWGIYYPSGVYGGAAFTIYYKEPQSITPYTPVIFNNISVNLIQLTRVLPILQPVLDLVRGHYHFEVCDKANGLPCDPTFSPYESFIFEDDIYWIGADF